MPVHAVSVSACEADCAATPAIMLVGTLAVPFLNSWNASYALTLVPAGAPVGVPPGSPLPAQRTTSVAWHAALSKSRSA